MTLTEQATGKVVLTRNVRAIGDYNQLDNQFSTLISRESMTDNMLRELGDTIANDVMLYFAGQNETPATAD